MKIENLSDKFQRIYKEIEGDTSYKEAMAAKLALAAMKTQKEEIENTTFSIHLKEEPQLEYMFNEDNSKRYYYYARGIDDAGNEFLVFWDTKTKNKEDEIDWSTTVVNSLDTTISIPHFIITQFNR